MVGVFVVSSSCMKVDLFEFDGLIRKMNLFLLILMLMLFNVGCVDDLYCLVIWFRVIIMVC